MLVDPGLIEKAKEGDAGAFNHIVIAYRSRIMGTVLRLINRREDTEDVAQEVFVRLYYSLDQLRSPDVFEPWLYRLTVNASYDYLRKLKRRPEDRMSDMSENQVLAADSLAGSRRNKEELERTNVREVLEELFAQVPADDRILLLLKEVEGLSLKEMAAVYNTNENVLKVRLFRARQRMMKAYGAARTVGNYV